MIDQSAENYLAAVARMQERQMSWGRPTRSDSTGSISSTTGDSMSTSPHQFSLTALAPQNVAGSSTSGGSAPSISGGNNSAKGKNKGKGKKEGGVNEHKARKKVAKACLACQKSHLTCDEQRPCTRCVKKGLADQCVEGVRKKAKYLLEGEERLASRTRQGSSSSPPPASNQQISEPPQIQSQFNILSNVSLPQQTQVLEQSRLPDDIWLSGPPPQTDPSSITGSAQLNLADPTRSWNAGAQNQNTGFIGNGTAANTEYQMLDSLFGNLSPIFPGIDPLDEAGRQMSLDNMNASTISSTTAFDQSWLNPSPVASNVTPNQFAVLPTPSSAGQSFSPGTYSDLSPNNPTWQSQGWPVDQTQNMLNSMGQTQSQPQNQMNQFPAHQIQNQSEPKPTTNTLGKVGKGLTPAEVYKTVVKPYDYIQGYHFLMDYLTKNFDQQDTLRVARALASFRPSLIALQMPMSEEDEVFLERSFQRTLIELEKLISYSATPTAVWRRTGEVCYANPEFCKLVDRTDTDLLGNKTYIYELFSNPSVVSYWENFSVHAFENTTQNFFQPVGLIKPNSVLNCTGCVTIRRNVFDLPSVIIGQFLPVPTDM
ncbi:uncharacterized protein IL334_001774 [Kwoniella shivajii]|uniref:Transcription activator of gluconeogenesis ERT1 n=1 Tax=Kwoniella shivajii TaxID=564305 RepID=A0ABZ1CSV0_9TREE|nr:hypothetical protein IL334_001774 [Kwoniella shivajii]